MTDGPSGVHTFLIADIRGYSRFTETYGDEAAAELSRAFADAVRDIVETHEGELREMRGDEALAVFASARQAIRAAVELQEALDDPTNSNIDIPCKVGIGIDSGEAVQLEDGSFRGAALNVASRLCGRAHGGEVLVSEATVRLAGRLGGLHYSDRGRLRLKNIPDPIHVFKVSPDLATRPASRSVLMFFGRPGGRTLTWSAVALVVLVAAITAAAVVYLTAGDGGEGGQSAGPRAPVARGGTVATLAPGAANAGGYTDPASPADATSATSTATMRSSSGRTPASTSPATRTSSSSRARTVATTRVSPTGGARGTTASAKRANVSCYARPRAKNVITSVSTTAPVPGS